MFQDVPLNTLDNEGATILGPEAAENAALALLRLDPKFRAYTDTGLASEENTSSKRKSTTKRPSVDCAKWNLCNRDSNTSFSSRRPNHALIWALIDDRKVENEESKDSDHALAVSYMEGWQPHPWKGQIWKATEGDKKRVTIAPSVDLIWSGRDWLPYTGLTAVEKPFVYLERSKASVGLLEKVSYSTATMNRRAPIIPDEELNDAYVQYSLNPSDEEDNLKLTLYAYVRGTYILALVRKLLSGKHEIAVEEDDIVMEFVAHLLSMLLEYKHDGRMHSWVKHTWKKYFFPSQQREVIEYTKAARWVNEVHPGDKNYRRLKHFISHWT